MTEANPLRGCTDCGWTTNRKMPHASACGGEIRYLTLMADEAVRRVREIQTIPESAKEVIDHHLQEYETRSTSSTGGQKGVKLERPSLVPVYPLRLLAEHYGKGAKKYAPHQWRKGVEWDKLYDAVQRHLMTFWGGEDYDICPRDRKGCAPWPGDESALPMSERDYEETCYNHTGSLHLVSAAWMIFALIEETKTWPEHDNRYKPTNKKADNV